MEVNEVLLEILFLTNVGYTYYL